MQPPFVQAGKAIPDEDPDKRQKQAWEYKLLNGLLEVWRKHQDIVLEWLKKNRDVKKQIKAVGTDLIRDKAMWAAFEQDHVQLMLPVFEQAMEEAVLLAIGKLPFEIGAEWELVNAAAAKWARKYSYSLISGINDTTRKRLQASINNWIEAGETFPDLVARVQKIFVNPVRAEMIAATEITRVFAEANTRAWEESGVVRGRRWTTANDERVCPICGPLGGLEVIEEEAQPTSPEEQMARGVIATLREPAKHPKTNIGYEIPAHPSCRCWWTPIIME